MGNDLILEVPRIQTSRLPFRLSFQNDGKIVGCLEWSGDSPMRFEGDAEESAKRFFDYLIGYLNPYIDEQINRTK